MARGEYELKVETAFQQVTSVPRRHGVMFNPASSRSRLRIVDGGRRYEVQLTEGGEVQYRVEDGAPWQPIAPRPDPITGQTPPPFLSYDQKRAGEAIPAVRFDMIAVGRGRILAKEAGTDRIFHLVMDELFRTHQVRGKDFTEDVQVGCRSQDPAVPGTYLKLDPEFFVREEGGNPVPPEATRDYAMHPASLRFWAFSELLASEVADVALVMHRPRVWYQLDARSPLAIVGPEDFHFTEEDLRVVCPIVGQILRAFYEPMRAKVHAAIVNRAVEALPKLLETQDTFLVELIKAFNPGWITDVLIPTLAGMLADGLVPQVVDALAAGIVEGIRKDGFGGLLLPGNAALLLGLHNLREAHALVTDLGPDGSSITRVSLLKAMSTFPGNQPLSDAISELFRRGRSAFTSDPASRNPPPDWMPVYTHLRYRRRADGFEEPRRAIRFSRVLDLGVGYSHWTEHWQTHLGGEIQGLRATRPIAQQERYNLMQYRFLNGPVIDGDAYNDGTCNFYMLVELGATGSDVAGLRQRYAILWIDEQSYFTQRWRLVHPTDDVMGDLFSLQRTLKDTPEWFQFSIGKFWSPFADDLIDDDSRMAVRRQIIAVTGYNRAADRREIYTICFNYGTCDHTWRWRPFPLGEQVLVDAASAQACDPQLPDAALHGPKDAYVCANTLDLRDDSTLHVKGTLRTAPGGPLVPGRWVQRYLPADSRHVPRPHQLTGGRPTVGFSHPWDFVSEAAYGQADRYYQFGVFAEVESRCQYYEVDLLPDDDGRTPSLDDVTSRLWQNDASAGVPPLRHDTVNFDWSLQSDRREPGAYQPGGYITLGSTTPSGQEWNSALVQNRRTAPTMSMYEPTTRFRILQRDPLGTIAVFYDKRDDELQSASHLPQEVIFQESLEDTTIPTAWADEEGGEACGPSPRSNRRIRLLVKANRRVIEPPVVRKARVAVERDGGKVSLRVSFWTPQNGQKVAENIWKVNLAAVEEGGSVPIFGVTRFPNFVRAAEPAAPLPLDFDGALGDAWKYEWLWKELDAQSLARVERYCSRAGHMQYATSLWFEDVVGHCATAEETLWE